MSELEYERLKERWTRTLMHVLFNAAFALLFAYLTFQIIPNMIVAAGQFVTFMLLALRNMSTVDEGTKTLATAIPVRKQARLKVGRVRADVKWTDEDGEAIARPTLTQSQKASYRAACAETPEVDCLVYSKAKTATTAIQINNVATVPAVFAHSTLRPPGPLSVTNLLVLLNTLAFCWSVNFRGADMIKAPPLTLINVGSSLGVVDQPWRLISSCFLHLAWWHILLNMFGLLFFGYLCEGKLGRLRYTLLYFFCCLGGSLASAAAFGGTTSAVGASGAIMGLAGFITALTYLRRDLYKSIVVKQILIASSDIAIIAILYGFVFTDFINGPLTDNAGHTGGFIAGMLAAFVLPRATTTRQIIGRWITLALALAIGCGLWTVARMKYFDDGGHGARAMLAMARGDKERSNEEFDLAVAAEQANPLPPDDTINGDKTFTSISSAWKSLSGSIFGFDRRRKLADLYNSASWGKSTMGEYDEAVALADKSVGYEETPASLDTRAVAYMGKKDYVQARRDLIKALAIKPDYGACAFHLAQLNLLDPQSKTKSSNSRPGSQHFDYDPEDWEYRFGSP
ncbi:MAG: rhomboid family intramembrane serine protease [Cyanobacteria bacterium REEB67]|nr:rhomboid family intramembrane serine protease [Cyanobacteria bacterium REEB67]